VEKVFCTFLNIFSPFLRFYVFKHFFIFATFFNLKKTFIKNFTNNLRSTCETTETEIGGGLLSLVSDTWS